MVPTLPSLDCCGCSACANVCPHDAISMVENREGFLAPYVNANCCVGCLACERACPVLHQVNKSHEEVPLAYAARIKDEKVLKLSSSGGIFSALALSVIQKGGLVFGAAFDESLKLHYASAETDAELAALRGSKYLQASVDFSYRSVKSALEEGRIVLFSGTPCQIAGLYGFLGNGDYPRLLTVDVVCHGVPSPKVFRKYIRERESVERGRIQRVRFRDKVEGWKNFSVAALLKPETEGLNTDLGDGRVEKTTLFSEDLFMRAFLSNICLRPSCHACHYNQLPRVADITLGDYWGVEKVHPELDDDLGVSLVLVNSQRGAKAWAEIQSDIMSVPSNLRKAIRFNPCIYGSSKAHKQRGLFFERLDGNPLGQLVKVYCKRPSSVELYWREIIGWTRSFLAIVFSRNH